MLYEQTRRVQHLKPGSHQRRKQQQLCTWRAARYYVHFFAVTSRLRRETLGLFPHTKIWFINRVDKCKLTTVQRLKADVSSVSPLSEFDIQSDSLWRRANARNVSFSISVRWPIYINHIFVFHFPTDAAPQFLQKLTPLYLFPHTMSRGREHKQWFPFLVQNLHAVLENSTGWGNQYSIHKLNEVEESLDKMFCIRTLPQAVHSQYICWYERDIRMRQDVYPRI